MVPNTVVRLLKDVDIDRAHNHTYRFVSLNDQQNFFRKKAKFEIKNGMYQRYSAGAIKCEVPIAGAYDCNYLMFQNTGYKDSSGRSRWFYAFIDRVEYVNENTTIIYYTVDVIQTWWFDFEFTDCMIEREHAKTDKIGDNVVPEPVGSNDYFNIVSKPLFTGFNYMMGLVLSKPFEPTTIAGKEYLVITGSGLGSNLSEYYSAPKLIAGNDEIGVAQEKELAIGQTPSVFYWYGGIPITGEPDGIYLEENLYCILPSGDVPNGDTVFQKYHATDILSAISKGRFKGLTSDNIVGVFMYPRYFTAGEAQGTNGVFESEQTVQITPKNWAFAGYGHEYFPKNNKLYTFPFRRLYIDDHMGTCTVLNPDKFTEEVRQTGNYTFYFRTLINGIPQMILFPKDYNGTTRNYNNAIYSALSFDVPFKGNAMAEYLQQNKGRIISSTLNMILGASGLGASSITSRNISDKTITTTRNRFSEKTGRMLKNPSTAKVEISPQSETVETRQGAGGSIGQAISMIGSLYDLSQTPPATYGSINCVDASATLYATVFTVILQGINAESARIIDDFFTKYGYATKVNKYPGIYNRKNWVYIKSTNCLIHNSKNYYGLVSPEEYGAYSTGMSANDAEEIENIFDSGITLWNPECKIGDYSINNGTVTRIQIDTNDAEAPTGNSPSVGVPVAWLFFAGETTALSIRTDDPALHWEVNTPPNSNKVEWVKTTFVYSGKYEYCLVYDDLRSETVYIEGV